MVSLMGVADSVLKTDVYRVIINNGTNEYSWRLLSQSLALSDEGEAVNRRDRLMDRLGTAPHVPPRCGGSTLSSRIEDRLSSELLVTLAVSLCVARSDGDAP